MKSLIRDSLVSEGVAGGMPPPWPGNVFTAPTEIGQDGSAWEAMVGSPNVLGVAWILIQHPHEMGDKVIHSITVWDASSGDGESQACLYIELREEGEVLE